MIQILPAILATNEEDYSQKVAVVNSSLGLGGGLVHVDIADNTFVKNQTVDEVVLQKYPFDNQRLELHLMVDEPAKWLKKLSTLPIARVIAHSEIEEKQIQEFLKLAKEQNLIAGLALGPQTPMEKLKDYLPQLEIILVMGINPGFSGQEFIPETVKNVSEAKKSGKVIGVDGGMNIESAKLVIEAGADYIAMAKALFYGDIDENLEKIWEALQ